MMEMHKRINSKRVSTVLAMLLISVTVGQIAWANPLSLEQAEALAILNDPSVWAIQANKNALAEYAIAAGQFPDPMVKLGVAALPTDTFNLGQEPMIQFQFGIVQKFPRGKSRSLRTEQLNERSRGMEVMAQDQNLRITLAVREEYLEILKQQKLAIINKEAIRAFTDLADITQENYATGRVQQQDVLRASVEWAKVQDRATQISQEEDQARIQPWRFPSSIRWRS
ncbi:MAG: outer membrane protein TolC [Rhodothermales bacterium]|jgi:outer membrane protein TolC